MRLLLSVLLVFSAFFGHSYGHYIAVADTGGTEEAGFFGSAANRAKLVAAKHEFNESNMRGALTLYREILETEPNNGAALYWTARCHYALKRYDLAKKYLDRAVEIDPEVQTNINYFYGMIHHRLAELDEAIESFSKFLQLNKGKDAFEVEEAERFIAQCRYAKKMMQQPVDVTIENMGPVVNTRFDEYAPAVTADGKLLLFTSRRSDATGGEIDEGGDYKFFEDVYFSEWSPQRATWIEARGVDGEVNTPDYDAVLSVAPDGSSMYVYRNNAGSAGNIFVSRYNALEKSWYAPEEMPRPISTSYFESSCSITADGSMFYFISERPEGLGQGDIYVAKRQGNGWAKPENLGKLINTELDEKFVFIHPNGRTLYFASDGHQTLGSYDIFRSEFVNGQWSVPINLGYPINTVNEESTFSLTGDNKVMYIAAEYADALGERDIYTVDVSRYPLLSAAYDKSNYGTVVVETVDADGKPVKGAQVQVVYSNDPEHVIISGETDKVGRWKVNLPNGDSYRIAAIDGKRSANCELVVPEDATATSGLTSRIVFP